jgi:hypothetical protein
VFTEGGAGSPRAQAHLAELLQPISIVLDFFFLEKMIIGRRTTNVSSLGEQQQHLELAHKLGVGEYLAAPPRKFGMVR